MREVEKPRPLTVRTRLLARLIHGIARGLWSTLRLTVEGAEAAEDQIAQSHGAILVTWHGLALFPALFYRGRGFWALVSLSKDGDIQARNFVLSGYRIVRGSTGRGAVRATLEVIQALKAGGVLTFTPDGPRGPARKVQPGVIYFAQKAGKPIIPVGFAASPAWRLPTWDSYLVPKPFSRARMVIGAPISAPRGGDTDALCAALEAAMNAVQERAEAGVGRRGGA